MKFTICLSLGALLSCVGCTAPQPDEATTQRIAQLETRLDAAEKRSQDLALKSRIISNQIFASPLDRFFASPEFWENTYDSGQADCARRCTTTLQTEFAACANNANPTQCRTDALAKGSMCQTQCSQNFPPPIP